MYELSLKFKAGEVLRNNHTLAQLYVSFRINYIKLTIYNRFVFSEISVRRSKYCPEFSIIWERLKISRWLFHSWTIFDAHLINSLRFSKVNLHSPLSRLGYFSYSVEKRKTEIFWFQNIMEGGIRKFFTFVLRYIASKIFGKIILPKPL